MKNSLGSVFSDSVASVSPRKKLLLFEGESEYPLSHERTTRTAKVVGSRMKRGSSTGSSKLLVSIATPSRSSNSKKTTSTPPQKRTIRGSASFSGITHGTSSGPRCSGGKLARHGYVPVSMSSSRRRILAPHNIELEDDGAAMGCQLVDHNVRVIIRARPVSDAENAQQGQSARCVLQENAITVAWLGQPETRFTFDYVADEFVTQEELFHVAGLSMVDNCMAGYNSCMFAYGQTGSGKTHTMLGDLGDCESRGMTPRVFEYLFAKIRKEGEAQKQRKLKYKCRCSFLEIYNEQIFDLLEPSSSTLQMREDGKKGVFVEGLLEVEVQTVEEVLHLLLRGATNRKVASTHMNRESSRSHSVFTCVIESQWECNSMMNFRFGRLNLVDLAGSERQKDTGVDEERLREAASINKSLSTLGLVIMVLVDIANGKHRHVPYRDSKLTFLLQDSLGGNSKTTIIANISPSSCASSETLSTLKFAQRAKFIRNNAVVNEEASGDVKGLQQQIQELKDELARVRRQSIGEATPTPTAALNLKSQMEALLVGVLRREKFLVKSSAAEIEHLALLLKQRQDEIDFHKSTVQSQERKLRSEPCDAEESSGDLSELELIMCNNLDRVGLDVENVDLQGRLRRCQEYDGFEEGETMVQDISNLRNKLLDMLDTNLSMDTTAALLQQQEEWAAKLAVERQATDQLRNEVEACQRNLSECQMKLQTSLDSNERIASELDALRMELESSRDECSKHKRELEAMQLKKALVVNGWEMKQAQHQQFVCESKTQLEKREEIHRTQIELQLQEAMQESANLQTELQWTRDSLEEAEAVVETFQRIEPVLEIGDPEAAYEFFMVGQLQAEIIEMNARLEEERRHRRELDNNQMKATNSTLHESARDSNADHEQEIQPFKEKRKIRHQDAILQLQLELDSVDGGASLQQPINNTQIQLDMETMESALAKERQLLTEARATIDHLRQQLEELTAAKLIAEKSVLNNSTTTDDGVQSSQLLMFSLDTENADLQDQFQETLEADSAAWKPTIANLQRELEGKSAEIAALVAQLRMSDRHVFKLECQNMELRDAMRRQGVAVKALCEKFQKQESSHLQEERAYRENATQLQSRVELLQQELEKMQLLQNEKALIDEEHHSLRSAAAQKIEQLRSLVAHLEKQRGQLQQEVKRKQSATESLERRLLVAQQQKLQCQEDLRLCTKMTEKHKMRAQEKQVEVEILGKSVEELENTVLALESQVGLLKREGDRQCLVREDMESELRVLKLQNNVMHATLPEASGTSGTSGTNGGGVKRESNAERKLKEREVEKLEQFKMGSDENDSFSQTKNTQKEKGNAQRLSIGSAAFRCFNMNHQVRSELDEERKSYDRRILELEGVLEKHQHEVMVLKERLEDAGIVMPSAEAWCQS